MNTVKYFVRDLYGTMLLYAVAVAKGHKLHYVETFKQYGIVQPSDITESGETPTSWVSLRDRSAISITEMLKELHSIQYKGQYQVFITSTNYVSGDCFAQTVARAFVIMKCGERIELPENIIVDSEMTYLDSNITIGQGYV